jgi:hypothetical protein
MQKPVQTCHCRSEPDRFCTQRTDDGPDTCDAARSLELSHADVGPDHWVPVNAWLPSPETRLKLVITQQCSYN